MTHRMSWSSSTNKTVDLWQLKVTLRPITGSIDMVASMPALVSGVYTQRSSRNRRWFHTQFHEIFLNIVNINHAFGLIPVFCVLVARTGPLCGSAFRRPFPSMMAGRRVDGAPGNPG
ncbi:MAG: hypothetical protein P4M00_08265 [Azospirillaceae bacterium]|nr:hypothetical protein [Azospirillaceae bacterium]